ncbi:uncharacterized protein LOC126748929 [Anthonomus grandis grandis]|uniref:uncharacterized protein LOC126748929 n=1 Tax=Anthonomus grandis grandis TaxID=2921223 RepID=UPI00216542D4|nr:uncharacterized protein LOC126748929 [Anthonomus grandis grandis]
MDSAGEKWSCPIFSFLQETSSGFYDDIPEETSEQLREYEEDTDNYSNKDIVEALKSFDEDIEQTDENLQVTFAVPESFVSYTAHKTIEIPESMSEADKQELREMFAAETEAMFAKPKLKPKNYFPELMTESDKEEFRQMHAAEAKALMPYLKKEFGPAEPEHEEIKQIFQKCLKTEENLLKLLTINSQTVEPEQEKLIEVVTSFKDNEKGPLAVTMLFKPAIESIQDKPETETAESSTENYTLIQNSSLKHVKRRFSTFKPDGEESSRPSEDALHMTQNASEVVLNPMSFLEDEGLHNMNFSRSALLGNEEYLIYNSRKWALLYTVGVMVLFIFVLLGYLVYKEFFA